MPLQYSSFCPAIFFLKVVCSLNFSVCLFLVSMESESVQRDFGSAECKEVFSRPLDHFKGSLMFVWTVGKIPQRHARSECQYQTIHTCK